MSTMTATRGLVSSFNIAASDIAVPVDIQFNNVGAFSVLTHNAVVASKDYSVGEWIDIQNYDVVKVAGKLSGESVMSVQFSLDKKSVLTETVEVDVEGMFSETCRVFGKYVRVVFENRKGENAVITCNLSLCKGSVI